MNIYTNDMEVIKCPSHKEIEDIKQILIGIFVNIRNIEANINKIKNPISRQKKLWKLTNRYAQVE